MAPSTRAIAVLLLLAAASAQPASSAPTPVFASFDSAIKAATDSPVSVLLKAVKAAGVAGRLTPDTAWTILAPTDAAFEKRLSKVGLKPADLLKPENKGLLVKVLSYHVIPAGALASTDLSDGQAARTALAGAAPLTVELSDKKVSFAGAQNKAAVVTPNIRVGKSVVHVVDDVLLPAGVVGAANKPAKAASGRK